MRCTLYNVYIFLVSGGDLGHRVKDRKMCLKKGTSACFFRKPISTCDRIQKQLSCILGRLLPL